jgi:hypothetical protein
MLYSVELSSGSHLLGMDTMRRNVWEATAREVHIWAVVFLCFSADVLVKVRSNCLILVPWSLEIVAETTGRAIPSDFRVEVYGPAYTRNIGACCLGGLVVVRTFHRINLHTGNIGLN